MSVYLSFHQWTLTYFIYREPALVGRVVLMLTQFLYCLLIGSVPLNEGDYVTFGHISGQTIKPGTRVRQPDSEYQFVVSCWLLLLYDSLEVLTKMWPYSKLKYTGLWPRPTHDLMIQIGTDPPVDWCQSRSIRIGYGQNQNWDQF